MVLRKPAYSCLQNVIGNKRRPTTLTIKTYILFFLLTFGQLSAQTYNLDNKFSISIPKRADWNVSTHYCDTVKNIYQYLTLRRDLKNKERKFSDIVIKYETLNDDILADLKKDDCLFGTITKIDTINISGYKVRRRFGTNCDWTIEDRTGNPIAGYSVDIIISLDKSTFLRIMCDYFTADKSELNSIESELLAVIDGLKIQKH